MHGKKKCDSKKSGCRTGDKPGETRMAYKKSEKKTGKRGC